MFAPMESIALFMCLRERSNSSCISSALLILFWMFFDVLSVLVFVAVWSLNLWLRSFTTYLFISIILFFIWWSSSLRPLMSYFILKMSSSIWPSLSCCVDRLAISLNIRYICLKLNMCDWFMVWRSFSCSNVTFFVLNFFNFFFFLNFFNYFAYRLPLLGLKSSSWSTEWSLND